MAVNIGPKIGIEGESEYRKQINNIITQAKTLSSEMKVVESSFKAETTAQEKAAAKAQVLNKQVENQKKLVAENSRMLQESSEKYGENDARTLKWQQALNNATAELNKMETELEETQKVADGYGNEVEDATGKQDDFVNSAIKMKALEQAAEFLQKASDKFKEFADAAVGAAKDLDVGYDTIATKTGATGDQLEELNGIADNLFATMPATMEDVGKSVGEVNTRLGLTGDELQDTSELFLQFARINGTDVSNSVDAVQKALSAFGLEASDTARILDVMTAAGQDSGVGMDELASAMVKNAGALTELGLSAEESIMFIGRLEKSGVDSETALSGMSRALKNATKQGIPLDKALADLEDTIVNGTGSMDGLSASYDLFGKSGDKIYNALKVGSISFKDLTGNVKDYSGTVTRTYEATLSPWDKTQVAMNNLKKAGSDLAQNALSTLAPAIDKVTKIVQSASEWFGNLSPNAQKVVGVITALGGAALIAGPKVLAVVKAIEGFKIAQSLSAGVNALTAAQTGQAASAAAAKTAQDALNASMLANPVTWLVAGVAALSAAVLVYANHQLKATKEQRDSIKAMEESRKTVQDLHDRMQESAASYEAEGAQVDKLVSRLKELQSKTELTASEQAEMQRTVAQLNNAMPGLNATIDTQTGKLAGNTSEVMKNIDAWKQSYDTQLKQKQLEQILDDLATANNELAKAEAEQQKYSELGAGTAQGQAAAMDQLNAALKGNVSTMKTVTDESVANEAAWRAANDTANSHRDTIAELEARYDEIVSSIDAESAALVANGQAEEGLIAQNNALEGSEAELANSIFEGATTMQEAYAGVAQAAYDSVMQQSNLFQKLESDASISLQSMNEALVSQAEAYNNYAANTNAVLNDQRYQTDAAFRAMADSILNMGIDGRDYLQQFVNAAQGSGDELSTLLANYGNVDQAVQAYANATAGFQTATSSAVNGVDSVLTVAQANFNAQAQQLGAQVPEGTSQGITTHSGEVSTAVNKMLTSGKGGEIAAETVGTAIGRALARGLIKTSNQIKTNATSIMTALRNGLKAQEAMSKTQAQNAGRNVATALAGGLNSGRGQVQSAATQLGQSVNSVVSGVNSQSGAARSAGANLGAQLAAGIRSQNGSVSGAASNIKNSAVNSLNSGTSAKTWGKHLGDNFASGIAAARPNVVNEAQKTADAVARILKHSTPKEGPLKDDDVWGLHLGQNLALGMQAAIPSVRGAAMKMAKAAASVNDNIPMMMLGADEISGRSAAASSTAYNYGGFTVVVNGAPGQDVNELADVVMNKINAMVERKAAAIA